MINLMRISVPRRQMDRYLISHRGCVTRCPRGRVHGPDVWARFSRVSLDTHSAIKERAVARPFVRQTTATIVRNRREEGQGKR